MLSPHLETTSETINSNQPATQIDPETFKTAQKQIDSFTRTLKVQPFHKMVRCRRAEQYLIQKRYKQCLRDCNKVLEEDECNIRCMIFSAVAYLALGDRESAIENLVDAKALDSSGDEFKYALSSVREWDSDCFEEISKDEFTEGRVSKKSWMKPKTEPSWDDKVSAMLRRSSFGMM